LGVSHKLLAQHQEHLLLIALTKLVQQDVEKPFCETANVVPKNV